MHHQGSMRGLKMARGSPLGKGAGTGVKREMKMERMRRLFLLDILILLMARSPERLVLELRVDSVQWKINHHYNVHVDMFMI